MREIRRFKAQSTLEYAMIIAVVVGALLAIQIYMKRGLQGKLRESTDQIGEQFEANKTSGVSISERKGTTVQEVSAGVTTSYTGSSGKGLKEQVTTSGNETVEVW